MDELGSGWRIKPLIVGDPKQAEYVARMVREIEEERVRLGIQKKPPSTIQAASTIKAIELQKTRDPKDDKAWANRPLPESTIEAAKRLNKAIVEGDIDTIKEMLPHRIITPEEYSHFEAIRRRPKNSIGQSEESSVSDEAVLKAIHAFTYSEPAVLTEADKEKITTLKVRLLKYSDLPPPLPLEAKKKPTISEKVRSFFGIKSPVIHDADWNDSQGKPIPYHHEKKPD